MTTDTSKFANDGLREAAAASLEDVDALDASGEDRKIILAALLKARVLGADAPGLETRRQQAAPAKQDSTVTEVVGQDDVVGRISTVLGLDRDVVEQVYSEKDGEPILVVSSRKVASNKSAAAREIAQLIAAARQAVGLGEWTSVGVVRDVVSDYGRLDSSNFAASLQQLDGVVVLRGKGLQREIKVTRQGLEAVTDMVRSMAGGE